MPAQMPDLAGSFSQAIDQAVSLAAAGENARVLIATARNQQQPLTLARLELLYEMAYLQIFLGWETFLEQSFLRYLCGYSNTIGVEPLLPGRNYYRKLEDANTAMLAGKDYVLWHRPQTICSRVQGYLYNGLHFNVIQSATVDLERYVAIRHRIAHSQEHAKTNFNSATMNLNATRYRGSRAGKFLRDWDISGPIPIRWLEKVGSDLLSWANQITP